MITQPNATTYIHRRVTDAEYRVRKMRGKDLYMVTEYYKGDRVQLCEDDLVPYAAHELAYKLADREEF